MVNQYNYYNEKLMKMESDAFTNDAMLLCFLGTLKLGHQEQ